MGDKNYPYQRLPDQQYYAQPVYAQPVQQYYPQQPPTSQYPSGAQPYIQNTGSAPPPQPPPPQQKKMRWGVLILLVIVIIVVGVTLATMLPSDDETKGTFGTIILGGYSVTGGLDINGDGHDDIVIGTAYREEVFVLYGRDSSSPPFDNPLALSADTANGTNGFILLSYTYRDKIGFECSRAGDINGDGIDDLLIAAPLSSVQNENVTDVNGTINTTIGAGQVYLVFGRPDNFPSILDLDSFNGSDGVIFNGSDPDAYVGFSVSGAGDVNADGIDDLIISGPLSGRIDVERDNNYTNYTFHHRTGLAYVIYGKNQFLEGPFPRSIVLNNDSLKDGEGFIVGGLQPREGIFAVSGLGDVNGDQVDDFILSTSTLFTINNTYTTGRAFIVFGQKNGFPSFLNVTLLNGTNGFEFAPTDRGLRPVGRINDINGDGINDIIVGNLFSSFIIYGRENNDPFPEKFVPDDLDGNIGFKMMHAGTWVTSHTIDSAGDVNNDGKPDFMLGASLGNDYAGHTYIVFGRNSSDPPFPSVFNLDNLGQQGIADGVVVNGINRVGDDESQTGDFSGSSVSMGGDVNGDNITDLIIGARFGGGGVEGQSYLLYGWNQTIISSPINLRDLV